MMGAMKSSTFMEIDSIDKMKSLACQCQHRENSAFGVPVNDDITLLKIAACQQQFRKNIILLFKYLPPCATFSI